MSWHYLATNQYGSVSGWGTNNVNEYIITQNQIDNAQMMWSFFRNQGYSEQATAAIIGNAMWESLINPGQFEYGSNMSDWSSYGLGLLMWTPKSKIKNYADSVGGDVYSGDLQCRFYLENETPGWNMYRGLTQYPNYPYIMTPGEFKLSTQSPSYLAEVFGCNYEGGTYSRVRSTNSDYWYNYFTGTPPGPGPEPGGGGLGAWFAIFKLQKQRRSSGLIVPKPGPNKWYF